MEDLRQAWVAWHKVWYGFLAMRVAMGFKFLSRVRTSFDHLVEKVAENCETVIFLSFLINDGDSGFGDFIGMGLLTDRWVWLWEHEVWFFWFRVVDDFSRFMGSWVWLIFWASFHLLFCRTWRIVLGSPALFWVCICFGFALVLGLLLILGFISCFSGFDGD